MEGWSSSGLNFDWALTFEVVGDERVVPQPRLERGGGGPAGGHQQGEGAEEQEGG